MKTPTTFVQSYMGKAIDYDGAYGVQCVDGFEVGVSYLGIPTMPTPNNWADGFWTCLNADGTPNTATENWQKKYFDKIRSAADFHDGDWVIWARGSGSHPSSHVAMFYEGQEFGENQGGNRAFCLKQTDFSDALGALRPKAWSMSIRAYESNATINGHLYYLYRQAGALQAVVLSPGLNKTALIKDMDTDADVFAKITGCNYFQMRSDVPDQPYGTTYGPISAPRCGVYQNLPNQDSTMFFDLETAEHADCTGINIDPQHNVFSPALIYQRGHNVQYARMVGLGLCKQQSTYTFLIRFSNGDYGFGLSDQNLTPDTIAGDLMTIAEVDSVSFLDGGGSAQMMRYITAEHRIEYTKETPRATAGCIALIAPSKPVTEPQQNETGEGEEEPMEEVKPAEQPEIEPVENWQDPEEKDSIIVQRIAALLSVKSLITIFLTVIFGLLVLRGAELPDKFVSIYTMCISFFFGYQFKKAENK